MAKFLSEPSENATSGERSFSYRLETYFEMEKDVLIYFEPNIQEMRPDFLILSPRYGVIIAEIKDYSGKRLKTISKSGKWEYLQDEKTIQITNPFDQTYQYWRAVKDAISFSNFPDRIEVPINRIVAFSNISESHSYADKIRNLSPKYVHICFEEVVGRNDNFEEFIRDILPVGIHLPPEHFSTLRANIIPTSRLPTPQQRDLSEYFTPEKRVKLLDEKQEKLARELGEGHRLIFGVAGSGKTVLLIARARYLAIQHPNWKILIICYNKLLKNLIFHLLNPQDYQADITISTYHSWARQYILGQNSQYSTIYNEAEKKAKKEEKMTEFFHEFVPRLLLNVLNDKENVPVMYDAILIDEAQDFEKDWFKTVVKVLNPDTNSLLVTCDGLQGIYARKRFTWSSVGIQARGRVRRFEKSYRNPIEIGALAQKTLPDNLIDLIGKYDEFLSTKEFSGIHGTIEILVAKNRKQEYRQLAEKISRLLKNPQEIIVLFKYNMESRCYRHIFFKYLEELDIEWKRLVDHNYKSPGLFVGTLHGTKGLEADTIIIPEVHTFNSDTDRQLLYVGMTRTRKKLILSANKSTELVDLLKDFKSSNGNLTNGT